MRSHLDEGGGVGAAHAAALEDEGGVVDPGRDRRRGVLGEAVGDRSDAAHRGQPIGGRPVQSGGLEQWPILDFHMVTKIQKIY